MQRNFLGFKILAISGLMGLFCMGLLFLSNLVSERQGYQQNFLKDIAQNQVSEQSIISPYIRIPYTKLIPCSNDATKQCTSLRWAYVSADRTSWQSDFLVSDQNYKRSIYRALSYQNNLNAIGQFAKPNIDEPTLDWNKAEIVFPIHDARGLKSKPTIQINSTSYEFNFSDDNREKSGFDFMVLSAEKHPELISPIQNGFKFNSKLDIEGLSKFVLIPTSHEFKYKTKGNWQDIKYDGQILPLTKLSRNNRFEAEWNNIAVGKNNLINIAKCQSSSCLNLLSQGVSGYQNEYQTPTKIGISAEFIEQVNIYSQTDRAIKYGVMIILITFASFFLFEVLKGLRIHPIQYTLVALAQGIFFLLLLSISEYYAFALAYLAAATACVLLMTWYLYYIMHGFKAAMLFSIILSALYGMVYLLLQSSGKTFLMGSILSFILLACVMYLTRHVNWYQLSENNNLNRSRG
ncbi:cell envelope integrity protein CreD [Acinetobacter sp. 194]|uniref:cell envelope integrity protein CreD n=1 Tax=Acinetobacter shaoyimingii TaxID=2715164 RepID=UPI001409D9AB|nr:cell envelope integrity protein CreD [Acinetobacter shaoyimingii]NHB59233.1 cell envelope integrity protein CreD [Acinetobacter shaoyimingii]